jgi:hypothetical protein
MDAFLKIFKYDQSKAFTALYDAFSKQAGKYSIEEHNKGIAIIVNGIKVTITGSIIDGIPRISDAWIK